jgi:hypothetical protein
METSASVIAYSFLERHCGENAVEGFGGVLGEAGSCYEPVRTDKHHRGGALIEPLLEAAGGVPGDDDVCRVPLLAPSALAFGNEADQLGAKLVEPGQIGV